MARQTLTKTTALGAYASAGVAVTMTAADPVNFEEFVAAGNDLIIIQNTGASPHTYTVNSTPDPYGRTKDISSEAIAAGEIRVAGPLEIRGWIQTDGKIYLQADSAEVKFGIVKLPG